MLEIEVDWHGMTLHPLQIDRALICSRNSSPIYLVSFFLSFPLFLSESFLFFFELFLHCTPTRGQTTNKVDGLIASCLLSEDYYRRRRRRKRSSIAWLGRGLLANRRMFALGGQGRGGSTKLMWFCTKRGHLLFIYVGRRSPSTYSLLY